MTLARRYVLLLLAAAIAGIAGAGFTPDPPSPATLEAPRARG